MLSITGKPSPADVSSLNAPVAKGMMDDIKYMKQRDLNELLGKENSKAKDFIMKLLHINPKKRMSAVEALAHPYMSDFHNTKEEVDFKGKIDLPINENVKLSATEYRELIEDIVAPKDKSRESSFQSPKSFSDLRKFSSKKSSKNSSKGSIKQSSPFEYRPSFNKPSTGTTNKIGSPESFKNMSRNQTLKSPTHQKVVNSPNCIKEVV